MRCLCPVFERSAPSDIGVDAVLCFSRPPHARDFHAVTNERADFFKTTHRGADFTRTDADKFGDFLVGEGDDASVGFDMGDHVVEDATCREGFWIIGVDSVPDQEALSRVD